MAFADASVWLDKKFEITRAIRGLFDRFSIPTTEKVLGLHTVDLIRELEARLDPVPEDKIDAGLDYLIEELTRIRGKK